MRKYEALEKILEIILTILVILLIMTGVSTMYYYEGKAGPPVNDSIPIDTIAPVLEFMNKTAKDGLKEALIYYDIKYPEIVYAQAILETGHFKSVGCIKHNNLFGLYDSRAKRYHRFNHWTESVIAYKEWIQNRYKPPEDYYKFLTRIRYASNPQYINVLRKIVKYESKSSKGDSLARDSTVTRK